MYKLVVSPQRYSALLYASHILDDRTVMVVLSNGYEEETRYKNFCMEALTTQRKFEIHKAYKVFKVRQLYHLGLNYNKLDYEKITVQLQLLLALSSFTHLYIYGNSDKNLYNICKALKRVENKVIYSTNNIIEKKEAEATILSSDQYLRKVNAAGRMITIKEYLLNYENFRTEYTLWL